MSRTASLLTAVLIFGGQPASCNTLPQHHTGEVRQVSSAVAPRQDAVERQSRKWEEEIRAAVEEALASPPPEGYSPIPRDVRLLSVKVDKETITLDFSKELLAHGTGPELEDALHQIFVKIGNVASAGAKRPDYKILVEGTPLTEYLDN